MNTKKGFIALLASALVYAFSGIFIRYASLTFGTFAQVALRGLASTVFFGLYFILMKKKFTLSPKIDRARLIIFLVTPVISVACAVLSIGMIKAANTIFYIYAGILISSLLYSTFMYKEQLTKVKIIALVLSLLGITFITLPLEKVTLLGAILGVIPGVMDSTDNAMIKYLGKFDNDSLILLQRFSSFILGSILFFVVSEHIQTPIQFSSILSVLALGLGMVVIISLYFYGFKNFDFNLGNIVTSAELIFILFLNALVLKEYPSSNELIGAVMIFLALTGISWQAFRGEKVNT